MAVVCPVVPVAIRLRSMMATLAPRSFKRVAAVKPVIPPPTIATSTDTDLSRAGYDVSGVVPIQRDRFLLGSSLMIGLTSRDGR